MRAELQRYRGAEVSRTSAPPHLRTSALLLIGGLLLLIAGCRQDMHDQPKYQPFERDPFFADQRASRPLVTGVVARGHLDEDQGFYTGASAGGPVTVNPLPLDHDTLARGQERYNIYCSPCHDRVGAGEGMIVLRGFKQPPTFHSDRLRTVPDGYLFQVITNGFGTMSTYAPGGGARSLGDHRLHARPAVEPARHACRRAGRGARDARRRAMSEMRAALALQPDHILYRSQRALLGAGALGLAAAGAGGLIDPVQFFRSYLVAYLFFVGIALGSLGLVSLNHVTGGLWGVVRRVCESAMRAPPLAILPAALRSLRPLPVGAPEAVAHDPSCGTTGVLSRRSHRARRHLLRHLDVMAFYLVRWSREQGPHGQSRHVVRHLQFLGRGAAAHR